MSITISEHMKHLFFLLFWIVTLLFIPCLLAEIDYAGPACTGSASNGCNCDNSRWECRDGYDALALCPHGACFVSLKGQPTCGESYMCQPCTTDEDCLAPQYVVETKGRTNSLLKLGLCTNC